LVQETNGGAEPPCVTLEEGEYHIKIFGPNQSHLIRNHLESRTKKMEKRITTEGLLRPVLEELSCVFEGATIVHEGNGQRYRIAMHRLPKELLPLFVDSVNEWSSRSDWSPLRCDDGCRCRRIKYSYEVLVRDDGHTVQVTLHIQTDSPIKLQHGCGRAGSLELSKALDHYNLRSYR
jgi:hypothetical protein